MAIGQSRNLVVSLRPILFENRFLYDRDLGSELDKF